MGRAYQRKSSGDRLVPDPARSAEEAERYRHEDLHALTALELWAEDFIIKQDIARRTFLRERPRVIHSQTGVSDWAWLLERGRRLRAQLSAQRRGAA